MLMTVLERQKEIGVLMALGLSRRQVVTAIVLEALVFGLIGSAIGALLGCGASFYFAEHGMTFSKEEVQNMPFQMAEKLAPMLTPDAVIMGVSIGLCVAVFGSLGPSLRASGIRPVEALRRK